ncbi:MULTISPECIES: efflux RND transporter periplasmic adaptor subunit [Aliiglaciecola]|uniref:efflux RND transporter periplasmic adaptor subunit n=1 Tax=Aliiglaciecola TaxID=1406885 RepID=UPI001C0A4E20|nr:MULTISPECIES: efflux RND transporter periplasmic adaptor subunit [Aliiglaciecola]MBU2879019.1 efflux RND transporter periplasmic adaptor subunit [Aliiglaciecola lipolytica]MDO6710717.1 efflux RND transporter periplasmic adaptor subunit [Aliiglaciecola sp. 2_MG-2023]MDO6751875.1 efflux RND transporter periplasmic adaptor subunit [Aliiglaciecola sp. 1_MG-2023]
MRLFLRALPARFLLALSVVLLSACGEESQQQFQPEKPRVVKLTPVISASIQNQSTFPAVVSPVKTIDLSFEVTGRLIQTDIVTGENVEKGHLLASLDPKPFERRVKEQQTRLQQADRELSRIESMFDKKLVSQSNLDDAKTEYELAEIDLSNALQDLEYTKLRAPFDALVANRLIDNNSFVTAGQSLAQLQDVSRIYFNINVPERVLSANEGRKIIKAQASILGNPDKWYDLVYVEHSTQPDAVTQTYQAVFALEGQNQIQVTPGARAMVNVTVETPNNSGSLLIPFRALVGNDADGFFVWRYVAESQTVEKVQVNVHSIEDATVVVDGELNEHDFVISAGATLVKAGMKVEPYHGEK